MQKYSEILLKYGPTAVKPVFTRSPSGNDQVVLDRLVAVQ